MDKDAIKFVIQDQKEKVLSKETGLRRDLLNFIEPDLESKEIIIIGGARRSGKSTLLLQIVKLLLERGVSEKNILYVNFEDERLAPFKHSDFQALYESYLEVYMPKGKSYFFLDEIQNVALWEKWVNRIYEFEDVKMFITGSNTSLFSSAVSDALTGRNLTYIEYPFSLCELEGKTGSYTTKGKVKTSSILGSYFEYGGFPEVALTKKRELLVAYLRDVIDKDIIIRHNVKNKKNFDEFIFYLLNLYSKRFTFEKLQHIFKFGSVNTVKKFIGYAEEAYLIFSIENYSSSLAETVRRPRKLYVIDHAMAAQVSNNPLQDRSAILENIAFLEMRRKLSIREHLFYWTDTKGGEVDFLLKHGSKIVGAFQVMYKLGERKDEEVGVLLRAMKEFGLKSGTFITYDYEGSEKIGTKRINYVPISKLCM